MISTAVRGARFPDWLNLPHAEPGNRIGLFGGSFNPPHSGHRMVAETALKRLKLDQVWWLVSPGNPLKDHSNLAPLPERVAMTKAFATHPRMRVTAHEARLGSPFTARTVSILKSKRPKLRFVWIMGADNLAGFHRWQNWRHILADVPVAVVNRPGASLSPLAAPMAKAYYRQRVKEDQAGRLPLSPSPAWIFLHAALDEASSTNIRQSSRM